MIKNAILHPIGEQPILVDLLARPQASDVSLLCTNVRTIDGKRPRSVDHPDAFFVIPMATLRLIEVPGLKLEESRAPDIDQQEATPSSEPAPIPEAEQVETALEADIDNSEELLRRIREL